MHRRVAHIVLCCALGCVVNVLVAWTAAAAPHAAGREAMHPFVQTRGGAPATWTTPDGLVIDVHAGAAEVMVWQCNGPDRCGNWPAGASRPRRLSDSEFRRIVPAAFAPTSRARHPGFLDDEPPYLLRITEYATGWPLPCLRLEQRWVFGIEPDEDPAFEDLLQHSGAIVLPEIGSLRRHLPCIPIFGAFLADTALYTLAAAVMLLGPGALRSAWRRRDHRCPSCGYPAGPSPTCPECGQPGVDAGSARRTSR